MSEDSKFWLNWMVYFASASGTFLAVFVALFGDKIKSRFFSPKLSMRIRSLSGELCPLQDHTISRWYHLEVRSEVNWPSAHGVQIYLTGIYEKSANDISVIWKGEVPFRWRHQEVQPLSRTIGSPYSCDLCFVSSALGLNFTTLIQPYNLLQLNGRKGTINFLLDIEARADEGTLVNQRYELFWNGKFSEVDSEMERNLEIRLVTS